MNISESIKPAELVKQEGKFQRYWNMIPLPIWLIVPLEAVLLFLMIIPTFISIWLSLISWQPTFGIGITEGQFLGLKNYYELLTDPRFLYALLRTGIVTIVCVGFQFLIGLGLAMLLQKPLPLGKFIRLVLILPMMFPPLVVGNNFYLLFYAEGPINALISYFTGSPFKFNWLSSPTFAIYPIMLAEIWQWYPLMFLIMLAGLKGLPTNQLRAAEVLGASAWHIFWRIKIPQMMPIILIAFVIRAMEVIKLFDLVYIMTHGGPGTVTETISVFMYKIGLTDFRISYISAGAWIVLIASVVLFVYLLKPILYKAEKFEEEVKEGQ